MVNREAIPLVIGLCIPVVLLIFIIVQLYGVDFISFMITLDYLYYVALFPILLGLVIAIANRH